MTTLDPGCVEVVTLTVAGEVTAGGDAAVTVSAIGIGGDYALDVAVSMGDDAAAVAGKIRTALGLDATVSAFFAVSGSGGQVILTVLALLRRMTLRWAWR